MIFSSHLDQGLRLQPLALAESGDGRGQEKSAKGSLRFGRHSWGRTERKILFDLFFLRGEKRQSLSASPTKQESGGIAAPNPRQGSTPEGPKPKGSVHASLTGDAGVPKTSTTRRQHQKRKGDQSGRPFSTQSTQNSILVFVEVLRPSDLDHRL